MWGKREQWILWSVTYAPLILIMFFRFLISNNIYFGLDVFLKNLNEFNDFFFSRMAFELYFIIFTVILSFILFKITIKFYLYKYDEKFEQGGEGEDFFIREINKLSANDYSFFLLTLLLPLISLDHSSIINLFISIMIIIYVINIYVKTDSISVCPIFFFSGRAVYKGIISTGSMEEEKVNPALRRNVVMVMKKENLDLINQVRGEELVGNVYYISKNK